MTSKKSKSDEVVAKILDALKNGEFRGGSRLPSENALARQFGVSRPTLREGIKKLEQLGAVTVQHGNGSFINSDFDARENQRLNRAIGDTFRLGGYQVTQYLDARAAVENAAIELAVDRMDDSNYLALQTLVEEMEQEDCVGELYIEKDAQFHKELAKASKNSFIEQFWLILEPCFYEQQRRVANIPGRLAGSKALHRLIFEALIMRDKKGAQAMMNQHLSTILGRFFTVAGDAYVESEEE